MKKQLRKLGFLALLILPVSGMADMWFDFPEGSPVDWPSRSGPSYPVFESPWFPPSYSIETEGKSAEELYGGRKLHVKEIEKARQGLPLLQFSETFNPLKIGPSDFYLESKNGAMLIDPKKFKDITQTGIGIPANSVMLKLLDASLSKFGAEPRIHNFYDTLVSAIYMNIETINKQKVIVLKLDDAKQQKGDGIEIPEPFYFSQLEGMSWLIERGFISARGTIKDIEAFKAFGGAQQAEMVLLKISGLDKAPDDWSTWLNDNKKVAQSPKPTEAKSLNDFAKQLATHELSLARYYNYESNFAPMTRTLPSVMIPGVLAALKSKTPLIRRNATALLGDLGSDEAHTALIATVTHKDPVMQHRALGAMIKQWRTSYELPLIKAYDKADPSLKVRILHCLGYGSEDAALKLLLRESKNSEIDIAYAAWRGLLKREDSKEAFMEGPAGKNTFMKPLPFIKLTGRAVYGDDKDMKAFLKESRIILKRINSKASWQAWNKYMQDVKGPESLVEALSITGRLETPHPKWLELTKDILSVGNRKTLDAIHPSWRNAYIWSLGRWASKETLKELIPQFNAILKRSMKSSDLPGDNSIFRDPSAQFRDTWLTDAEAKGASLVLLNRIDPEAARKTAMTLLKKLDKKRKAHTGDLLVKSFCIKILARNLDKNSQKLFLTIAKNKKEAIINRLNAISGLATTEKPESLVKGFLKMAKDGKDDPQLRVCIIKFLGLLDKDGKNRSKFVPLLVDENPDIRLVTGVLMRKLSQDTKFVNPYGEMEAQAGYRDYWAKKLGK